MQTETVIDTLTVTPRLTETLTLTPKRNRKL